jgi:hypothetical protein
MRGSTQTAVARNRIVGVLDGTAGLDERSGD